MRTPLLGVISAITPFNHPLNMVSHKLAPAIATNNRMVLKPTRNDAADRALAGRHPLRGRAAAGNAPVVTGDPTEMRRAMIADPDADLVTFTGGAPGSARHRRPIGYRRRCWNWAGTIRSSSWTTPIWTRPPTLAVTAPTKNSGQRCTAVKRILVARSPSPTAS